MKINICTTTSMSFSRNTLASMLSFRITRYMVHEHPKLIRYAGANMEILIFMRMCQVLACVFVHLRPRRTIFVVIVLDTCRTNQCSKG